MSNVNWFFFSQFWWTLSSLALDFHISSLIGLDVGMKYWTGCRNSLLRANYLWPTLWSGSFKSLVSLKVWPHCEKGLLLHLCKKGFASSHFFFLQLHLHVILFWLTVSWDCCLVLLMIFRIHSPLTLLVWLSVPEQYSKSHHALRSVYGPLFPDQALISSALNEPQLLYLAAPDPWRIMTQLRSTTSRPLGLVYSGEHGLWDNYPHLGHLKHCVCATTCSGMCIFPFMGFPLRPTTLTRSVVDVKRTKVTQDRFLPLCVCLCMFLQLSI